MRGGTEEYPKKNENIISQFTKIAKFSPVAILNSGYQKDPLAKELLGGLSNSK